MIVNILIIRFNVQKTNFSCKLNSYCQGSSLRFSSVLPSPLALICLQRSNDGISLWTSLFLWLKWETSQTLFLIRAQSRIFGSPSGLWLVMLFIWRSVQVCCVFGASALLLLVVSPRVSWQQWMWSAGLNWTEEFWWICAQVWPLNPLFLGTVSNIRTFSSWLSSLLAPNLLFPARYI